MCGHTLAFHSCVLLTTVNHIRARLRPAEFPRQILARAVLDAGSLDEAVKLLTREPRSGAFHHTLGQCGDPRVFSVEATGTGFSVQEITQTSGHANHLIAATLSDVPQVVTGSSESRQKRLNEWLSQRGDTTLSAAQALDILNDQSDNALPILRQDPHDPDEENTLATAIFVLGQSNVSWQIFTTDRTTPVISGDLHVPV